MQYVLQYDCITKAFFKYQCIYLQCNPSHVYSEASLTELNGTDSQVIVYRIAVLMFNVMLSDNIDNSKKKWDASPLKYLC